MNKDLAKLAVAFRWWRRTRKHQRQPVPPELLEKARSAVSMYGLTMVVEATGLRYWQLRGEPRPASARKHRLPNYSRLEVQRPANCVTGVPLVEAESPQGIKLRVFSMTSETSALLGWVWRGGHEVLGTALEARGE